MRGIVGDFRTTVRSLMQRPVFTGMVALTLALAFGANSSVFAILQQVILRPLPYDEPASLVVVHATEAAEGAEGNASGVPVADFLDISRWSRSLEGVAAMVRPHLDRRATLVEGPRPERVAAATVSANFFRVLGVEPRLGRTFVGEDSGPDSSPAVILSHGTWQGRFGADLDIVGRTLRFEEGPRTVVGVLGPDFEFPLGIEEPGFWLAETWEPGLRANRDVWLLDVIGRLAPGAVQETVAAEMVEIGERLGREHPETHRGRGLGVVPLRERMVGDVVPALRLLGIAGVLVLLVACVNVAVLLLARGDFRREELALRRALGASPARMARLLLSESAVLALLGAVPGVLLGYAAADLLTALSPVRIPRLETIELDPTLVGFAFVLCLVAAALAGVLPVVKEMRGRQRALGETRGVVGGRPGRADPAGLLVGLETALVLVLLSGAALTSRSLAELLRVDPGFDAADRMAFTVDLPAERYSDAERIAGLFDRARAELVSRPGIREVGTVSNLPLEPASWSGTLYIRGEEAPRDGRRPQVDWEVASPGYFRAMGIPLLEGRTFRREDDRDAPPVTVINETMARRYWPDGDPLGSLVNGNSPEGPWRRVVGVVGDVKQQALGAETRPQMYISLAQSFGFPTAEMVVHADEESPAAAVAAVRRTLADLEPGAVIAGPVPLQELVEGSVASSRFRTVLLGVFGAVALLLGLAGIYGVVNHWVARRTREIGVRVALGAGPRRILSLVARRGLVPAFLGAGVGLAVAVLMGSLLEGLIYGLSPTDPPTLLAVTAVVLLGAALAATIPALRALRISPVRVMKE